MNTENMAGNPWNEQNHPCSRPKWPARFTAPHVDAVARRLKRVFDQNANSGYFTCEEIKDYSYYERMLVESLEGIDRKIIGGRLSVVDLKSYPRIVRMDRGVVRACIYIGSFDPFQLTHCMVAMRFLASEQSNADFVIVVPEGSADPRKPLKTDYAFRLSIARLQIDDVFDPFMKVLDLGSQADTIEIVRRFIGLNAGLRLELTHLIGSDVLPVAARYLEQDLKIWRQEAKSSGVDWKHRLFVVQRSPDDDPSAYMPVFEQQGIDVAVDASILGTPSSTDFRDRRMFTIILPTPAIREKMEILFRYRMHRNWTSEES
ncbi:MAG: hypothetical protein N2067_03410 [Spirochaetaceae bacterium]|nr:hypothetical protein [Spirochaetaceae bacterium]